MAIVCKICENNGIKREFEKEGYYRQHLYKTHKIKKFWTNDKLEFLKNLWENSMLSTKEITKKFNNKYKKNYSADYIRGKVNEAHFHRSPEYLLEMRLVSIKKAQKKSPVTNSTYKYKGRIWNKDVINFIRKHAKECRIAREMKGLLELEFERNFPLSCLRNIISKKKIKLNKAVRLNSFLIKHKKFILRYKDLEPYKIRDKLIEKYSFSPPLNEIRKFS